MYGWVCPCRQCNGELDGSDADAYWEAVEYWKERGIDMSYESYYNKEKKEGI